MKVVKNNPFYICKYYEIFKDYLNSWHRAIHFIILFIVTKFQKTEAPQKYHIGIMNRNTSTCLLF